MLSVNKTKILFCLYLLLLISSTNAVIYYPKLELSAKSGNQRTIGRISAVFPIYQNFYGNNLVFGNFITMQDSRKATEGNMGIGYRYKNNSSYILGIFSHYDLRNTRYNTWTQQMTIGGEFFTEYLEFRINGYFPLAKTRQLSRNLVGATPRIEGHQAWIDKQYSVVEEVTMNGWDIEMGGSFPHLSNIDIFGGFYNFLGNGVQTIYGARIRTNIRLSNWFNLEFELQRDKVRGTAYFGGVHLIFNIGSKSSKNTQSRLHEKMTQMPIRDVDIVFDLKTGKSFESDAAIIIKKSSDLRKISRNLRGNYIITKNLDLAELGNWTPIGPFSGVLIGVYNKQILEYAFGNHIKPITINNLVINGSSEEYIGFFTSIESAYIDHIAFSNPQLTVNSESKIASNEFYAGILAGASDNSYVGEFSITHGKINIQNSSTTQNQYIGGLIGYSVRSNILVPDISDTTMNVKGTGSIGGIIGFMNDSRIRHPSANSLQINRTGDSNYNIGGIVGYACNSEIQSPQAKKIHFKTSHLSCVGGIVGRAMQSRVYSSELENIIIRGLNENRLGGAIGLSEKSHITDIKANSIIIKGGDNTFAGGSIGVSDNSTIKSSNTKVNSIFAGDRSRVGGNIGFIIKGSSISKSTTFVKIIEVGNESHAGGFSGSIEDSKINLSSVEHAKILGKDSVRLGGFIANINNSTVNNATVGIIIASADNLSSVGGFAGVISKGKLNNNTVDYLELNTKIAGWTGGFSAFITNQTSVNSSTLGDVKINSINAGKEGETPYIHKGGRAGGFVGEINGGSKVNGITMNNIKLDIIGDDDLGSSLHKSWVGSVSGYACDHSLIRNVKIDNSTLKVNQLSKIGSVSGSIVRGSIFDTIYINKVNILAGRDNFISSISPVIENSEISNINIEQNKFNFRGEGNAISGISSYLISAVIKDINIQTILPPSIEYNQNDNFLSPIVTHIKINSILYRINNTLEILLPKAIDSIEHIDSNNKDNNPNHKSYVEDTDEQKMQDTVSESTSSESSKDSSVTTLEKQPLIVTKVHETKKNEKKSYKNKSISTLKDDSWTYTKQYKSKKFKISKEKHKNSRTDRQSTVQFNKWFSRAYDQSTIRSKMKVFRDTKRVGPGTYELRIHNKHNYRLYFTFGENNEPIWLLGGTKVTQKRKDIPAAIKLAKQYANSSLRVQSLI